MSVYDEAVYDEAVFDAAAVVVPVPEPAPVGGTSVHLEDLWINDAADPSQFLVVPIFVDSQRTWTVPGELADYTAGRTVLIVMEGVKRTWTPQLGYQSLADADRLVAMAGRPVWVRDPAGGRVLAGFLTGGTKLVGELTSERFGSCQHAVVSLTFTEISADDDTG